MPWAVALNGNIYQKHSFIHYSCGTLELRQDTADNMGELTQYSGKYLGGIYETLAIKVLSDA